MEERRIVELDELEVIDSITVDWVELPECDWADYREEEE